MIADRLRALRDRIDEVLIELDDNPTPRRMAGGWGVLVMLAAIIACGVWVRFGQ